MTAKSRWEKFILLTQSPQNVTPIFFTRIWVWEVVCRMGPSFADNGQKVTSHVNYWKEVFVEVSWKQEWGFWRYVKVDVSWIHHYTPQMKVQSAQWVFSWHFPSNEEVIVKTEGYFAEFDQSYILSSLKQFEYRWNKCIHLRGDYVFIRI